VNLDAVAAHALQEHPELLDLDTRAPFRLGGHAACPKSFSGFQSTGGRETSLELAIDHAPVLTEARLFVARIVLNILGGLVLKIVLAVLRLGTEAASVSSNQGDACTSKYGAPSWTWIRSAFSQIQSSALRSSGANSPRSRSRSRSCSVAGRVVCLTPSGFGTSA